MSLVPSLNNPTTGQARVPAPLVANDNAIRDVVNGNIDAANLAANAVTPAKVGTVPHVYAYQGAAQTLTTGTPTALTFNSELFDSESMHSTASNTERITCVTSGLYVISAGVVFTANATGVRSLGFLKNGSTSHSFMAVNAASSGATDLAITAIVRLTATDYVSAIASHSKGSDLDTTAGTASFISAAWLGP